MKQDLLFPFLVIGIILPILFSPVMIDGLEFYAEGIEVEFQYPKNPTEIKLKPLIQFSDKLTFTHFISNVSGEELENEPVLDPPDIPPDLQEGIEFRDELSFVLEKWNPNE